MWGTLTHGCLSMRRKCLLNLRRSFKAICSNSFPGWFTAQRNLMGRRDVVSVGPTREAFCLLPRHSSALCWGADINIFQEIESVNGWGEWVVLPLFLPPLSIVRHISRTPLHTLRWRPYGHAGSTATVYDRLPQFYHLSKRTRPSIRSGWTSRRLRFGKFCKLVGCLL